MKPSHQLTCGQGVFGSYACLVIFFGILAFFVDNGVRAQSYYQLTSAQETSEVQSQVINMLIGPDAVNFQVLPSQGVFTITGATGDFQNYAVFSSLLNQTGNLTVEVIVGEPTYFYECQVVAWIPIDGGILTLNQFDVLSDTEGQVVSVIDANNRNDGSYNGPTNFVFNFQSNNPNALMRKRSGPLTKKESGLIGNILDKLQHSGKNHGSKSHGEHKTRIKAETKTQALITGGAARDLFMMQYVSDSLMSEHTKPEGRQRSHFSEYDLVPDSILMTNGKRDDNIPLKFHIPGHEKERIFGDDLLPPRYRPDAFLHGYAEEAVKKYVIPEKLVSHVIGDVLGKIHGGERPDRKRFLSVYSGIVGSEFANQDYFQQVGADCQFLANGGGVLEGANDKCLFEAQLYTASQLGNAQERIDNLDKSVDAIIQGQRLTAETLAALNNVTKLQQQEIDLVKNQLNKVNEEFAKTDYKFNDVNVAAALSSESTQLLSSTVALLNGQVQRGSWVSDQNFQATQEAFSGVSTTITQTFQTLQTNIEYLKLQQSIVSAHEVRGIYTDLSRVSVQLNTLIQELNLQLSVQMNYLAENVNLVNNNTYYYLNQITGQLGQQANVLNNLFPAIRDLQRQVLGNTDLASQYFLYKNIITNTPPVTDAEGYQFVTLNGTGRPSTPINKNMTRDGWQFNATGILLSDPCANNINILQDVAANQSANAYLPVFFPSNLFPLNLQSQLQVVDNPPYFQLGGSLTNVSSSLEYYFTFNVYGNFSLLRFLLMVNSSKPITDPSAIVAQLDTPTNRGCSQGSHAACGALWAPQFFLPRWRKVPNSPPSTWGTAVREQAVLALFYEYSATAYYLDVNSAGQFFFSTYNVGPDPSGYNIETLWVFQNYPNIPASVQTKNYMRQVEITQGAPFVLLPFQTGQNDVDNITFYPIPSTESQWLDNVTLNIAYPGVGSMQISFITFFSPLFNLIDYTLNIQSLDAAERNQTIQNILDFFNGTIQNLGGGSRKRQLFPQVDAPHLERVGDLLLPSGWREKTPKVSIPHIEQHALREQMVKRGQGSQHSANEKNRRRGLSPAGLSQQPLNISQCWQGNVGIGNAYFTYGALANFVTGNPVNDAGYQRPSAANLTTCVSNPGCALYQVANPAVLGWYAVQSGTFSTVYSDLVTSESDLFDATNIKVQYGTPSWVISPYGFDLYVLTSPTGTKYLASAVCNGVPVDDSCSAQPSQIVPHLFDFFLLQCCMNYVINHAFTPDVPLIFQLKASLTETDYAVQLFCAPYDGTLMTGIASNAVYRYPPLLSVASSTWTVPRSQWISSQTAFLSPYTIAGYDFSAYGTQVILAIANCTMYDYVGCAIPALNGLCQQGLAVTTSVASPGGPQMTPGCLNLNYTFGCSGLSYSACIHQTQLNTANKSVPVCTWNINGGFCRNYDPVNDPIALVNQGPTGVATIAVACSLRALDIFSCSFDGYCMYQNVLGSPTSGITGNTCLDLGVNALSAPFYNTSLNFNPMNYSLSSLAPFGITNVTIAQCMDPAVFCAVFNGADQYTSPMNWIFQALSTNPPTCEQLSITLTNSASCTNRLFYFSPEYSAFFSQCRLANNRQCQQDCTNFGSDLNTCLSHQYCLISKVSLTCFNYDSLSSVCPQYVNAPTVPGSPCIGPLNVCNILSSVTNMSDVAIPRFTGPRPYVNGWSQPLLMTSECIVLAGLFSGNLSYPRNSSRLAGVYSLPSQLSNACISYDGGDGNFMCYPAALFPSSIGEVYSTTQINDGDDYMNIILQEQQCRIDNAPDCLTATMYQSNVLACRWVQSPLETLGMCVKTADVPSILNQLNGLLIVYDQAGYMAEFAEVGKNLLLTANQFIALGLDPNKNLYAPGPGDDYTSLTSVIVQTGPATYQCASGYYVVGSLCCQNPNCYDGDGSTYYYNLNHVRWDYLERVQYYCSGSSASNTWSFSTDSTISIVCNQQFSYSPIAYNPGLPSSDEALKLLQTLIAHNQTLPPVQNTYACTPMMQPYLAPIVYPFANPNEVPNAVTYIMDSFGNLTNSTLTPLQRYPLGSPTYNGTYLLSTNPVNRNMSQPLVTFLNTVYQFDTLTSFSAVDISFSSPPLDMSSLVETVNPGQVGSNKQYGWTVSDFVATQLMVNISSDIDGFMTTANNLYGQQPQSWGARPEFGTTFLRSYGGSDPFGNPVAKTDSLITLYVSNKFIPVFVVTSVTQTFSTSFVATNGNGQKTVIPASSITVTSEAESELIQLGDYLVYHVTDGSSGKIYSAYGDLVTPCAPYSYARVCSETQNFSSFEYLNQILDNDPYKVRFISETFANVLPGACDEDPQSPSCVCGDALGGGITSLPVGKNILPSQYSFILQVLNYQLISLVPYPVSGCPNCTLWDWWVATMSQVGVQLSVLNFNTIRQTWSDVLCIYPLANVIFPNSPVDFFHYLWTEFLVPATNKIDVIKLTNYFIGIQQSGNYFICGNCILYRNNTGGILPPPRNANGSAPFGTCDPNLGTAIQPNVQPGYVIDALKSLQNVFCRTSSAFAPTIPPFDPSQSTWSFNLTMRPGVGTMVVVFSTPTPGAIYALVSSGVCPLVTNGTRFTEALGGVSVYLSNPFPIAVSFYVRVRQNASQLAVNETTISDPCNYDKVYSIESNANNTNYIIKLCNGVSYYQIWSPFNAFNCSIIFQASEFYEAYYVAETAKQIVYQSQYQSTLVQNQRALDNSIALQSAQFQQGLLAQQIQLLDLNDSMILNFNYLQVNQQQLSHEILGVGFIAANNTAQIGQLQVGYTQVQNNLTNIDGSITQIQVNQEISQGITTNLSYQLGNETAARNADNQVFQSNITSLSNQVGNLNDNVIPNLINNLTAQIAIAQAFSDAAKFKTTGWGQYVQSQNLTLAIFVGIIGLGTLAAIILGAIAIIWLQKIAKATNIPLGTSFPQPPVDFRQFAPQPPFQPQMPSPSLMNNGNPQTNAPSFLPSSTSQTQPQPQPQPNLFTNFQTPTMQYPNQYQAYFPPGQPFQKS